MRRFESFHPNLYKPSYNTSLFRISANWVCMEILLLKKKKKRLSKRQFEDKQKNNFSLMSELDKSQYCISSESMPREESQVTFSIHYVYLLHFNSGKRRLSDFAIVVWRLSGWHRSFSLRAFDGISSILFPPLLLLFNARDICLNKKAIFLIH